MSAFLVLVLAESQTITVAWGKRSAAPGSQGGNRAVG
jgi:hypothetical protein